jgi:tetratricopeptide (TPR) repeat protein
MAQECCDLGRKHLAQNDYESATKEFSKAVMTFEFILKNNLQHKDLKSEFADMLKKIIIPAYSNLSLCYLKMKKYNMVITFANQVLASDSANVKNLYRRGLARKGSKAFDEAIEDFEKVIKLDSEMEAECRKLISECKLLKIEQKKKEKEIAQKFIKGYAKNKPEASPASENSSAPLSLWQRSIRCIKGFCPKLFSKS